MEANTEMEPGKEMPDPLFDFGVGVQAKWETDIWGNFTMRKSSGSEIFGKC
jgi:hypothetical protein